MNIPAQMSHGGGIVRYVQSQSHPFDPICLDTQALVRDGLVEGKATAGRGNTVFFTLHNDQLVLRHFRRGGLARYISKAHYVFTGLNKTRAIREFDLLLKLQEQGLAAPRPYACKVQRHSLLFYTASLVTHRLPGKTLAEHLLAKGSLSPDVTRDVHLWRSIGKLVAGFHSAGVYHADLNAHNIMLDDDGGMALIDFDRGRVRKLPDNPAQAGWCLDNMNRLGRSLNKIVAASSTCRLGGDALMQRFNVCKEQWVQSLT